MFNLRMPILFEGLLVSMGNQMLVNARELGGYLSIWDDNQHESGWCWVILMKFYRIRKKWVEIILQNGDYVILGKL